MSQTPKKMLALMMPAFNLLASVNIILALFQHCAEEISLCTLHESVDSTALLGVETTNSLFSLF